MAQEDSDRLFAKASSAKTVGSLTREIAHLFKQAQLPSPKLDSRILVQHVFGLTLDDLISQPDTLVEGAKRNCLFALVRGRLARKPISRLIGKKGFWKDEFLVSDYVLDPRPDTECIIEFIVEQYRTKTSPKTVLDLGVGSGCILLSLLREFPLADGLGVDIDQKALKTAKENAQGLGMLERCDFLHSHWCEELEGQFDLVVSNPPYIVSEEIEQLEPEVAQFDPRKALDGGNDGLREYRVLVNSIFQHVSSKGLFVFEIGKGQETAIKAMIVDQASSGNSPTKLNKVDEIVDLSGTIRGIAVEIDN